MITGARIGTDTMGIDPRDSGVFELALLIYQGPKRVLEKRYRLNPLGEEKESAFNGCGNTFNKRPPVESITATARTR